MPKSGSAWDAGSAPAERDALAAGEAAAASRAASPASAQLAALRGGAQGAACPNPVGPDLGPARRSNASSDSGARGCGSGAALSPGALRLGSLEGLHFGSMGALGAAGGPPGSNARDLESRGRSLPNMPAPGASFGGCAASLGGAWEPAAAAAASVPEAAPAPRPHAHRRGMDSMEDVHMSLADSGLGSLDSVCAGNPGDGAEEMMQGMLGAPDAPNPNPAPDPAPAGLPPPGVLRGMPIGADTRGGTLPSVLEGGAWDLPWGLPSPLERKAASFGPGTQRGTAAVGAAPGADPVLGFQEPGVASPGFPAGFKDPLLEPPDASELELMAGGSTTAFAVPPPPAAAEGSGTPETLKLLLNLDNPPRAPPAPRAQADPLDNLLQFARAQPPPPPAAAQPLATSAPKAQDAVRPAGGLGDLMCILTITLAISLSELAQTGLLVRGMW